MKYIGVLILLLGILTIIIGVRKRTKVYSYIGVVIFFISGIFFFVPQRVVVYPRFAVTIANDSANGLIKLNQIGYYPNSNKVAIVPASKSKRFFIISKDGQKTLFMGSLSDEVKWPYSHESVKLANFSNFTDTGWFRVFVPDVPVSYPFHIDSVPYDNIQTSIIKSFYYQRASIDLLPEFAGIWFRDRGHADTVVMIHQSAASKDRPLGTVISSSRGWYDAGDFNKYIVSAGITLHNLLMAFNSSANVKGMKLNIPESNNGLPDVLDEVLWEVRWMLTMQDDDGGVYHKLTSVDFVDDIMPSKDISRRYVVQKSTGAALNFAASLALVSRVVRNYSDFLPGLSDSCLIAAKKAYTWALKNSEEVYDQDLLNRHFATKINTGTYSLTGDTYADEFFWAAMELYITTKDEMYIENMSPQDMVIDPPSWDKTTTLGYISIAFNKDTLPTDFIEIVKVKLTEVGDSLFNIHEKSPYGLSLKYDELEWRSNTKISSHGITLMTCYELTKDKKYLDAAMANMDYLLGKNPLGYCFVTGFGTKSPKNIHHRTSYSDGVSEPVPGLVISGAQGHIGINDSGLANLPIALRYRDNYRSSETNENGINQSAALFLLISLIDDANTKIEKKYK